MSRFHSLTIVGLVLLVTSALCRPGVGAASDELDYFHVCVTQEIPAALRRFVAVDGYDSLRRAQADIVDSVFSICRQRAIDSSHQVDEQTYVSKAVGALFEQIPKFVELEQQWKTDPEKALEDQAMRAYSICLQGAARALSRTSNDPSEVIEQASFARCAKNRQIVFDTFHSHTKSFSPEAMKALEQEFQRKLPQIVMKTRDDLRQATHQ